MTLNTNSESDIIRSSKKWEFSLSLRITILLVFSTLLLVTQSLYNLSSIEDVDESIDTVNKAVFNLDNLSKNIETPIADLRILSMEMVSAPSYIIQMETKKRIDLAVKTLDGRLDEWRDTFEASNVIRKHEKEAFLNIINAWQNYLKAQEKTYYYIAKGVRVGAFISMTGQEKDHYEHLQNSLSIFSQILVKHSKRVFVSAKDQSIFAYYALSVTSVVQVLILIVTLVLVYRMFNAYMKVSRAYEKKIKAKEYQLRMALENMPGGMLVVDKDLDLILVNEQYKGFYGNADGLTEPGNSMRDILRKEIELGYISGEGEAENILESRLKTFKCESMVTIQDIVQGNRTIQLVRNSAPDGHTVSVATDITEIVEARRGEKLLKEALDTFNDMVILYDRNEKVIFTNDRYHEIYPNSPPKNEIINFTMESLLRRSLAAKLIDQPLAKSDPEAWLKEAMKSRRNKEGSHGETSHKNGKTYFFRNSWTSEGGMILVQYDITERKNQENRIRRSEEDLHRILEDSPVAVMISLDDQSEDDGVIQFANHQFLEMAGIEKSSIGQIRTNSFVPDGGSRIIHEDALDNGASLRNLEQVVNTVDGRELWTLMSISPIVFKERQAALVWFYDITERKVAENKLHDAFNVISSSINYASRIQRSILPDEDVLSANLADHFILWEPRDVVGGDIYWHGVWGDGYLIVLGDCTGHGVPGAFMTIIAMSALERAMSELKGGDVGKLVTRMHQYIQRTLSQHYEGGDSDDGIELGACYIVSGKQKMTYVGARFELLINDDGEMVQVKGTKKGMGYRGISPTQEYEEKMISLKPNQSFYLTSDGLVDQIGGEKELMFGKKRLRDLLLRIQDKAMSDQKEVIDQALQNYQGEQRRRDDVSMIGFKLR